jgi:general secretion pathway protein G
MRSETTINSKWSADQRRRIRGLTLVEILAVVVILGFLAATLAVGFSGSFGKAKHELAKTGIGQIVDKVEAFRIEKGAWPTNDLGLRALSDGHAAPTDSFFLEAGKLLDPWKRPYYYVTPGPNQYPYEVLTYGADGAPGGGGEDADVTSVDLRGEK